MAAGPIRVGIALRNRSARAPGNRPIAPRSWAERTEGGDDLRRVHALPTLRIPGAGTIANCQVTPCLPAAGPTPRIAPLGDPQWPRAAPFFSSARSSLLGLDTRLAYLSRRPRCPPSVCLRFHRPVRSASSLGERLFECDDRLACQGFSARTRHVFDRSQRTQPMVERFDRR